MFVNFHLSYYFYLFKMFPIFVNKIRKKKDLKAQPRVIIIHDDNKNG